MTIAEDPRLPGARRIGSVGQRSRCNAVATAVALCALVFGAPAGVSWCRDAGVRCSLERQWVLRCDNAARVTQNDPAPGAWPDFWDEDGYGLQVGPIEVQWPYSFSSGTRRGQWTRLMRQQANHQLFEMLDFDGAIGSFEQLVDAPTRFHGMGAIELTDWPFTPLRRQARAYAARGDFPAALAATRRIQTLQSSGRWFCLDYDGEDDTEWAWEGCRVAAWKRLEASGALAESELRTALVGDSPLTATARAIQIVDALDRGRAEIRLTLAELLLREHRTAEVRPLLEQVLDTGYSEEDIDCKRLARAYLARLYSVDATVTHPAGKER